MGTRCSKRRKKKKRKQAEGIFYSASMKISKGHDEKRRRR